jgi:hypothetical protein
VIDQLRAVVDDLDPHPAGNCGAISFELLLQPRRDRVRVLAHQHEAEAEHRFAPPLVGHGPAPDLGAEHDRRHVGDAHRDAIHVTRARSAGSARSLVTRPTPWISTMLPWARMLPPPAFTLLPRCSHELLERQAVPHQALRDRRALVLLLVSTPTVDLGDARYCAQRRLEDPVLHGA